MKKKNRKFSLGQRVLFAERECEICQIDLTCDDDANIYALAELDAEHKISDYWEENIRNGEMITNNKKISIWVKEKEITLVENPKETLLEEAKRKYPKGTVYHCAHLPVKGESKCTVSDPSKFYISGDGIYESHGDTVKNKHGYNECIYDNGKWAEIVSTPTAESNPEIGRYITITDSYNGDEVFIAKVMGYTGERQLDESPLLILNDKEYWSKNNTSYTYETRTWRYSTEDEINHLDACIKADKYVEKPTAKEYKYKEGDEVSFKIYPGRKFIVRGYSENSKIYLISSEGFNGHDGIDHSITWGEPVKNKSNWWGAEKYLSPWVEKEEESFQIGRWYQNKNKSELFIKPTSIDGKYVTSNIIWSEGRYQEKTTSNVEITSWNLLDDLSIIQEFLPDGHPDKVVKEKTPKPKSFVGRYVKVLDARCKGNYGIKNGDYLLFDAKNSCGTYEHWGDPGVKHYHGISVHKNKHFELMPEGFEPIDALIDTSTKIHTELKVNTWYKYKIYSSEKWVYILVDLVKQVDTCKEVYYTQKIVDGKLVHESSSIMGTALDERLIEVDPSEIHLIISHNQYPLTPKETHSSWLNAQEEYHRQQHRYNLLMHERESFIQASLYNDRPLTPQECYKPCESKKDIVNPMLLKNRKNKKRLSIPIVKTKSINLKIK